VWAPSASTMDVSEVKRGSVIEGEVLGHASDTPVAPVLCEHDARRLEGHDRTI
jgi:hypothetical protein